MGCGASTNAQALAPDVVCNSSHENVAGTDQPACSTSARPTSATGSSHDHQPSRKDEDREKEHEKHGTSSTAPLQVESSVEGPSVRREGKEEAPLLLVSQEVSSASSRRADATAPPQPQPQEVTAQDTQAPRPDETAPEAPRAAACPAGPAATTNSPGTDELTSADAATVASSRPAAPAAPTGAANANGAADGPDIDPTVAAPAAATATASGAAGAAAVIIAPPLNLEQRFSSIHVRQAMWVNGTPTNVSYVGNTLKGPELGDAAELAELMRVWREEWFSFPAWDYVLKTRAALLRHKKGLWGRLSGPQRRMMCELTVLARFSVVPELCTLLLKRCALRQQHGAVPRGPAGCSPAAPPQMVHEERREPQSQAQPQHGPGSEQESRQESPPQKSDSEPHSESESPSSEAAGEEERAGRATTSLSGNGTDPWAEIVKASSAFRVGDRDINADVAAARRAAAEHFPAAFVTPEFVKHFVKVHGLQSLPEWSGREAGGGGGCGAGGECGGSLPELWVVAGCSRNLSLRQVWERIVAPALEATHGMSYAEAFLSQVVSYETFKPFSDMQFAASMGHRNLSYSTGTGDQGPLVRSLPDRHGIMVPYNRDRWDEPFTHLAAAFGDADRLGGHVVCVWADLFCSGAGPPSPTPAAGPAATGTPVATTADGAGPQAEAEAALARCRAVAILAPTDPWPLTAPLAAPPAASCAATTAAIIDAAARHGVEVVILRQMPPFWEKAGIVDYPAEAQARQAALQAFEDAAEPPLAGGGAQGTDSAAEAVRELWQLYRASTIELLRKEVAQFRKAGDDRWNNAKPSTHTAMAEIVAERAADASATAALLGPPFGVAVVRVSRVARLEGVPEDPRAVPPPAATGSDAVVLAEVVLDEQQLRCPVGMTQAEADELARVWATDWAGMPDLATVMTTWAACGGGRGGSGSDSDSLWSRMSYNQRRTACELVLLYGSRVSALAMARLVDAKNPPAGTKGLERRLPLWPEPSVPPAVAARWRPDPAKMAAVQAASSTGTFVTVEFLETWMAAHNLDGGKGLLGTYPGQAVWNPCRDTAGATTSWVCANVVVPATRAYSMGYSDLLLSAEAQEALLPPARDGRHRVYCVQADAAPSRAFASHAWATPFIEFAMSLVKEPKNAYWIDIFHKNQHQSVAISDLADNLRLGGQVALVVHPFPAPLVLTRVWCLFEIMTALQLGVPLRLFSSPDAMDGFERKIVQGVSGLRGMAKCEITPDVLQDVEAIDVSTAQATVAADKELILGMIRGSIGVSEMNRQVKELFRSLLASVRDELERKQQAIIQSLCFAGDCLVPVLRTPPPHSAVAAGAAGARRVSPAASKFRTTGAAVANPYGDCGAAARTGLGPEEDGWAAAVVPRCVADVRPGDVVVTADGALSRVVLVTRDEVGPGGMELCALPCRCCGGGGEGGGGGDDGGNATCDTGGDGGDGRKSVSISTERGNGSGEVPVAWRSCGPCCGSAGRQALVTPDHPVQLGGVWVLPRSVAPVVRLAPEQVPYGAVYNLELDPPGTLLVSGLRLVALGQDVSGQPNVGVTAESHDLWGRGWRANPQRERYLAEQAERERQRKRKERKQRERDTGVHKRLAESTRRRRWLLRPRLRPRGPAAAGEARGGAEVAAQMLLLRVHRAPARGLQRRGRL